VLKKLKLKPTDLEKPVAHRIEYAPARRAVCLRWASVQTQVFTQTRQWRIFFWDALHAPKYNGWPGGCYKN
jgi:hypothetical protein